MKSEGYTSPRFYDSWFESMPGEPDTPALTTLGVSRWKIAKSFRCRFESILGQPPADATTALREDSNARGTALPLANLNANRPGATDLGAIQSGGAELPAYGPRWLEEE